MNENHFFPKIPPLGKALFISGGMNIILLTVVFYWLVKDTPPRPYCELKPAGKEEQHPPLASVQSNREMIRNFRSLSLEQLVAKLTNTQLIENGYTQRDIALAALVAFHYFDLAHALAGFPQPEQQRSIPFGKNRAGKSVDVVVYPALPEEYYKAIIQFANKERWPVTSQGLFLILRKQKGESEPSLTDAFFLTPEFLAVETLFKRSEAQVDRKELLVLLCQGTWAQLSQFAEQQRTAQDLSPARRQSFLLDYIKHHSRAAAYLLLKTDGNFVARKLDNEQVIALLKLLVDKTPEAEQFTQFLLTSPRNDAVWQLAAGRLYEFAGEPKPEKNLHHAALKRFIAVNTQEITVPAAVQYAQPTIPAKKNTKPTKVATRVRTYQVQEGDSLWKISRVFKVDIKILKDYNRLASDFLKPGTTLKIPQS